VTFNGTDLTSQNHRRSVPLAETSPEAYFQNSVLTLVSCGEGLVLGSMDFPALNCVGRDNPLAVGAGWPGACDAGFAAAAVPTDLKLWYWCICTRYH